MLTITLNVLVFVVDSNALHWNVFSVLVQNNASMVNVFVSLLSTYTFITKVLVFEACIRESRVYVLV